MFLPQQRALFISPDCLAKNLTSWKNSEQTNKTLGQRHFQIILIHTKRSQLD